jgi:class 3 adenylate cyclase
MALLDDLEGDISDVLAASWDVRDGEVVPSTETVALSGGGVKIAATMLYADLADSTTLAMWDRRVSLIAGRCSRRRSS